MLASLTSKAWVWRKDQLMKIYKSLITYAALEWQPWAAPSPIEQLERCQNKALWVVTGSSNLPRMIHPNERPASAA